jgi:hypothetical protein
MVKPHVGNPIEKQLRADRRIQHSTYSENVGAA